MKTVGVVHQSERFSGVCRVEGVGRTVFGEARCDPRQVLPDGETVHVQNTLGEEEKLVLTIRITEIVKVVPRRLSERGVLPGSVLLSEGRRVLPESGQEGDPVVALESGSVLSGVLVQRGGGVSFSRRLDSRAVGFGPYSFHYITERGRDAEFSVFSHLAPVRFISQVVETVSQVKYYTRSSVQRVMTQDTAAPVHANVGRDILATRRRGMSDEIDHFHIVNLGLADINTLLLINSYLLPWYLAMIGIMDQRFVR